VCPGFVCCCSVLFWFDYFPLLEVKFELLYILTHKLTIFGWILMTKLWGRLISGSCHTAILLQPGYVCVRGSMCSVRQDHNLTPLQHSHHARPSFSQSQTVTCSLAVAVVALIFVTDLYESRWFLLDLWRRQWQLAYKQDSSYASIYGNSVALLHCIICYVSSLFEICYLTRKTFHSVNVSCVCKLLLKVVFV